MHTDSECEQRGHGEVIVIGMWLRTVTYSTRKVTLRHDRFSYSWVGRNRKKNKQTDLLGWYIFLSCQRDGPARLRGDHRGPRGGRSLRGDSEYPRQP